MTYATYDRERVLAIQPTTRGFGFAVFEGPQEPIDWGVKEVRKNKNAVCLYKIRELVELYEPQVLITEDYAGEGSRRAKRIEQLIRDIAYLGDKKRIIVASYSRAEIRKTFKPFGAETKYEIAKLVAKWLPGFRFRLPPVRKIWKSEDYRMAIFDAASLGLTYYWDASGC